MNILRYVITFSAIRIFPKYCFLTFVGKVLTWKNLEKSIYSYSFFFELFMFSILCGLSFVDMKYIKEKSF